MDTDELTEMAYQTITIAYDVSENLRAEIGASASLVTSEDDFLRQTIEFLDEILDDPEDYLDSWNMLDDVQVATFTEGVRRLRDHAAKTLVTPFEQRGEKPF